jgi:PGAP1-like protein
MRNSTQRGILRLLSALALFSNLAAPVAAQTSVVFVHGLKSDGSTWGSTPGVVASQLYITPRQPSLSSFSFFSDQATQLQGLIGSQPANMIAIGHSNGGIVSRVANYAGNAQPMQGIVTVGTPHRGAPLASNTMDGATLEYLATWAAQITQPLFTYAQYILNDFCGIVCGRIYAGVYNLAIAGGNALYEAGYLLNNVAGPVARETTVLGQMEPYSAFINNELNTGANLAREAGALRVRSAIISQGYPGYTSLFYGLTPGSEAHNTNWQHWVEAVYSGFYEYYYNYVDYNDLDMWDKRFNAWMWADGWYMLAYTDYHWCNLIGGWDYNQWACFSDGIVPAYSQAWQGAIHHPMYWGPGHLNQTKNPGVQALIVNSLRHDGFIMDEVPAAPPPSPPPSDPPPDNSCIILDGCPLQTLRAGPRQLEPQTPTRKVGREVVARRRTG